METPELDKMRAVITESHAIGDFLDWFEQELHGRLATYHQHDDRCYATDDDATRGRTCCGSSEGMLYPLCMSKEKLLAKYYGIDLDKVDDERRALLDEIRSQSTDHSHEIPL